MAINQFRIVHRYREKMLVDKNPIYIYCFSDVPVWGLKDDTLDLFNYFESTVWMVGDRLNSGPIKLFLRHPTCCPQWLF